MDSSLRNKAEENAKQKIDGVKTFSSELIRQVSALLDSATSKSDGITRAVMGHAQRFSDNFEKTQTKLGIAGEVQKGELKEMGELVTQMGDDMVKNAKDFPNWMTEIQKLDVEEKKRWQDMFIDGWGGDMKKVVQQFSDKGRRESNMMDEAREAYLEDSKAEKSDVANAVRELMALGESLTLRFV